MIIWLVNNESARNVKRQNYNTLIRPNVTYAFELCPAGMGIKILAHGLGKT